MHPWDLVVVVAYLGGSLGVGLWMSRRAGSTDDYFLGARDLPAWAVMLSIVATETSALTVISIPGIGAKGDFTFLQLAFGYLIGRIGVAIWLLPGYFDGRQQTAYERLQARFGPATRRLLSAVFLVTRLLADGVRIFAGAIPLALITGWDPVPAIVLMGAVTLLYTVFGGLKAVIWSDALQLVVYLGAGVVALGVALQMAGGLEATWQAASAAGKLRVFDLQLSLTAPQAFAASLVGGALLSAASHGADHLIVQRLLATRSLADARRALVGSGVLVGVQFALFLAVGTALWAAGFAPAELPGDQVFSRFVTGELPPGVAGLVVAGILAAAMSTISSSINALASSMTSDLYASWTGRTDREHLLRVSRWASLAWGLLLIGVALVFQTAAGLRDTPVVVMALSIASVTYGALLGALLLSIGRLRLRGSDVVTGCCVALLTMLGVVFAAPLSVWWPALSAVPRIAFTWYVPLGCAVTVGVALLGGWLHRARRG